MCPNVSPKIWWYYCFIKRKLCSLRLFAIGPMISASFLLPPLQQKNLESHAVYEVFPSFSQYKVSNSIQTGICVQTHPGSFPCCKKQPAGYALAKGYDLHGIFSGLSNGRKAPPTKLPAALVNYVISNRGCSLIFQKCSS